MAALSKFHGRQVGQAIGMACEVEIVFKMMCFAKDTN